MKKFVWESLQDKYRMSFCADFDEQTNKRKECAHLIDAILYAEGQ